MPVEKWVKGTAQTVINTTTDIASGQFSGAPAATFDNEGNGGAETVVPNAPEAIAMLELPDFGAAPAEGEVVELWGVVKDVDSTDDETDAPSGSSPGGAHHFGTFRVGANDALQRRVCRIDVEYLGKIDFYLWNRTSQNINNDGGTACVLKVTPCSRGTV